MTRKDAEVALAHYGKQIIWFRSPFAATALAPTVLWAIGVSPTRVKSARGFADPVLVAALRADLEAKLTGWPRPPVEVPESIEHDLRQLALTHVGDAKARLPEIRHQLNAHVDSSVGVKNTLFLAPSAMLKDGTLVYVFVGAVVAVDEPDFFRFDNEGRVHGETGPALRWRDGYAVFCWHGTIVPEAWVREKDKIDVEVALTWPNLEQRRAAAEIMGWKKVLTRLNAKIVDEHKDPEVGVLWHADLPVPTGLRPEDAERFPRSSFEPCRFIEVKCGTGRMFVIPVPPTIQTAIAAQEWMWGLGPGEYTPEERT